MCACMYVCKFVSIYDVHMFDVYLCVDDLIALSNRALARVHIYICVCVWVGVWVCGCVGVWVCVWVWVCGCA
jgi:hypothetical protein